MTEKYIENWNSIVTLRDTVYCLGDFAISFGRRDAQRIDEILSRLQGQKYLIKGNHDRKEVICNSRWAHVYDYKELKIDMGGLHKQRIVLFHYPLRTWNQIHRGAWHLHGHCHGNLPSRPGKSLDVGVDAFANHKPVSIDEVASVLKEKPIFSEDHHIPE